jgi:hypothetical protein
VWKNLFVLCLGLISKSADAEDHYYHGRIGESFLTGDFLSLTGGDITQPTGTANDLTDLSIRHLAIQPNGRYLFLGNEVSDFKILDSLSGKRLFRQAIPGVLKGLFWDSTNRLAVLSSEELAYYDLTKAFEPTKKERYEIPTTGSVSRLVTGGCQLASGQYVILESGAARDAPQLRLIQGILQTQIRTWTDLFPNINDRDRFRPESILCSSDRILVLLEDTDEDEEGEKLWMSLSTATLARSVSDLELESLEPNYLLKNWSLSANKERLMILWEVREDANIDFQTKLVEYNTATRAVVRQRSFEENLVSFGSFQEGSTETTGIFILNESEALEFHTFPAANLASTSLEDLLVIGLESDFNRLSPLWSFSSDLYQYALLGSTGVFRFSRAPAFQIEEVEYAAPFLRFRIEPSERMRFDFRFREESVRGDLTAPSPSWGSSIDVQVLEPSDTEARRSIELNIGDLPVTSNRVHDLVVFGRKTPGGDSSLSSREGVSFTFDPPPLPVRDFRLGFGDQSVHIFFGANEAPGDIAHYYLHLSTSADDLAALPVSEEEIAASEREIALSNNQSLQSPIKIPFADWRGKQVIAPLSNGQEIYARVQVVDKSGQFSENDPAALGIQPTRTRSLESAFGGNQSCGLRMNSENPPAWGMLLILIVGLFLVWRQKKWAQR